jgi:DNA-binding Lrp family transcriptional regulator
MMRRMPRINKELLEQDEIIVLDLLEHHAKESIEEIAKRCGFSRQKVWRIIKHLEENKTIWGYSAIADEEAENLKHFVLLLKRTILPFDDATKKLIIQENLSDLLPPAIQTSIKIENIYFTHGRYDAIVSLYAPNLVSAKKILDAISQQLSRYFEEYVLLETLFPIRKQGHKNPRIKALTEYI